MKKYISILFIFLNCHVVIGQGCQNLNFFKEYLENGYFFRAMEIDYIDTTMSDSKRSNLIYESKSKVINSVIETNDNLPKLMRRYNYVRFFDIIMTNFAAYDKIGKQNLENDNKNVLIGKVFMSKTYFENDFKRLFEHDSTKICTNEDGFYMMFKCYLTEKLNKIAYNINIYPDFNNFCNPKIHKQFFMEKSKCENYQTHFGRNVALVGIPDYEIQEYWKEGDNENEEQKMNYEINRNKLIKCFRLSQKDEQICSYDLEFLFTKYAQSTDRFQNNQYSYSWLPYSNK